MTGTPAPGTSGPDTPADERLFWLLTSASAVSKFGNQFLYLALPVLVLQLTGSVSSAVLTEAALMSPYLLAPVLGPSVDRLSRKHLFIGGELVCAAAVALIPVASAWRVHPLAAVYALVFVVGLASVLTSLTNDFTFIPSLLGDSERQVRRAYSLYNGVLDVARFAGPATAGVVIAMIGPRGAIWFDAATFLGTALAACGLPNDRTRAAATESVVRSFAAGWARFRSTPTLAPLTATLALYNAGVGSVVAFVAAVGVGSWEWSASTVGWVISAASLGSAAGAWSGRRLFRRSVAVRRIQIWLGLSAVASVAMLTGVHGCVVVSFWAMWFAAGAFNVETLTYRRTIIPDEFAGRVNAIVRCFVAGAIPVSAVVLAVTGDRSDLVKFVPVTLSAVLATLVWTVVVRRSRAGVATAEAPVPASA